MYVVQTLRYAFSNLKEQIKIVFSRATDGSVIVFANKIPCEMEIRLITSELPQGYGVKNMRVQSLSKITMRKLLKMAIDMYIQACTTEG
jgi:hypothetical protein